MTSSPPLYGRCATQSYLFAEPGCLTPRLCCGRGARGRQLVQLCFQSHHPPGQFTVAVLQELNIRVDMGHLVGVGRYSQIPVK